MKAHAWLVRPMVLAVSGCFGMSVWANPTGPQVMSGSAAFQGLGTNNLRITNTPGAIINWQGFSIGSGQLTQFLQQSGASTVLNRVVGADISRIHGQLLSNGRVFLINPAGILIGAGATIDTAGFVGSTLNMLDADFLAGKLKFQGDANSGSIVNQGFIRTSQGGHVVLVAPHIENSGLIQTPGGELLLAAGQKMTIASLDPNGVQFEIQAPTDSVLNVGKLIANGGAVGVFAGTLRHSGDIRANALVRDASGHVVLKGQGEVTLAAGSSISANGKSGGDVLVQSTGGQARVAGAISATGGAGTGGNVKVLGERVTLADGASIDASGANAGGQIRIGGDYQGGNPAIQNASSTFVGPTASLRADATRDGDGGRIIVWADRNTQFYGSLSAEGGRHGGNGGFAEVSGKENLVFAGAASLRAPRGRLGELLLDPLDLYVDDRGGRNAVIIDELADFPSNAVTVAPATLAAVGGNITLRAGRYMRFASPLDLSNTVGRSLTATVETFTPTSNMPGSAPFNGIDIGADITTNAGAVIMNAPRIFSFGTNPTITTHGGNITLDTTGRESLGGTIQASGLNLNASGGTVTASSPLSFVQLGNVTGGSFTALALSSVETRKITTTGPVTLTATGSVDPVTGEVTANGDVRVNDAMMTGGGAVTLSALRGSINAQGINAGSGPVVLNAYDITTGTIDTTGSVNLTALVPRGVVRDASINSRIDNASQVTAIATYQDPNDNARSSVTITSGTALNATSVEARSIAVPPCTFRCPSAAVNLTAAGDINVGTVAARAQPVSGSPGETVTLLSTGGAIRAMGADSRISAASGVTLTTQAGAGQRGIGTAALPIVVDVKRNFSFSPNGEFNVQLNGGELTGFTAALGTGAAPYTGALTGNGVTLNAASDAATVTVSNLNVASPTNLGTVDLSAPNGALRVQSMTVPTSQRVDGNLNVFVSASGDLAVDSYTRTPFAGGMNGSTSFTSSTGGVTLGTINGNEDSLSVFARNNISQNTSGTLVGGGIFLNSDRGNILLNSVISGNDVTATACTTGTNCTAGNGIVGAVQNSGALEIEAAGTISITGRTIGTAGFGNPLDLTGGTISLTSGSSNGVDGSIGFPGAAIIANTPVLTVNAPAATVTGSPVVANVNTGTTALQNLTIAADPSGSVRVTSDSHVYTFTGSGAGGSFTVDPGAIPSGQLGNSFSFTSTGGINAGNINLGTGALTLNAQNGSITGGATLDASSIDLRAGTNLNGSAVNIVVGDIGTSVRPDSVAIAAGFTTFFSQRTGSVQTGTIVPGSGAPVTIASNGGGSLNIGPAGTPANIGSALVPAGAVTLSSNTRSTPGPLAAGNIFGSSIGITASGALSTGTLDADTVNVNGSSTVSLGAIGTNTQPSSVGITANGGVGQPFQLTTINAGPTGSVSIVSPNGIQQTADGVTNGITAKTVSLTVTSGGAIENTVSGGLDLRGADALTVSTRGSVALEANGTPLGSLNVRKTSGADTAPFTLDHLGPDQTIVFGNAGTDLTVSANSPTKALAFTLTHDPGGTNRGIVLTGPGIVTHGGSVTLNVNSGGFDGTTGGIRTGGDTGGGFVSISANGTVNTGSILTTPTGTGTGSSIGVFGTNLVVNGNLDTGVSGGAISLSASNGSVTGGGTIHTDNSSSGVTVTAGNGDIGSAGTPLVVNAPRANLTARGAASGNVFATLTGTNNLVLSADNGFGVASNTAFSTLSVASRGTRTGTLNLTAPGQTFEFGRPNVDLFGNPITNTFQVSRASGTAVNNLTFSAIDGDLLIGNAAGGMTIDAPTLTLGNQAFFAGDVKLQGTAANPLLLSNATQNFSSGRDFLINGGVTIAATGSQSLGASRDFNVQAQSGSVLIAHSVAGTQTFSPSGQLRFTGGSGANETVRVTNTAGDQQVGAAFSRAAGVTLQGGDGSGAFVEITNSTRRQNVNAVVANVRGGRADGAYARIVQTNSGSGSQQQITAAPNLSGGSAANTYALIDSAAETQTISTSSTPVSLTAGGTLAAPAPNSGAIIRGNQQSFFCFSCPVTMTGGAGAAGDGNTSDALFVNLSGNQSISVGALDLRSGFANSTTGIQNHLTGTSTVGTQNVQAFNGNIALTNTNGLASAPVVIVNNGRPFIPDPDPETGIAAFPLISQTLIAAGPGPTGGVILNNMNAGAVSITSVDTQKIDARFVDVVTGAGSTGNATISTPASQWIHTNNTILTSPPPSLRVMAQGTGIASIESGATQLLEVDYPQVMTATTPPPGTLIVGATDAAGISRITAPNQSIFAGSARVLGGLTGSLSSIAATASQAISTLIGGLSVEGGGGTNSSASVSSPTQSIVANGPLSAIGGGGNGATGSITAATQLAASTLGNSLVTGGAGINAPGLLVGTGSQNLSFDGLILTAGASGSLARITTPGPQTLNFNALTLTAMGADASIDTAGAQALNGGTGAIILTAGTTSPTSAFIEGNSQTLSCVGCTVTMTGGTGASSAAPADALLRNLSGAQSVSAGNFALFGGQQFSTTGIVNKGGGAQTVTATGTGGALRAQSAADAQGSASVLIENQGASAQTLSAVNGDTSLASTGAGTVAFTSAGTQSIDTRVLDVVTAAGHASNGANATVSATGNQTVHTRAEGGTAPDTFSLRVASRSSGTAKIQSGAEQTIDVGYPETTTAGGPAGRLLIGSTSLATETQGNSLIVATSTTAPSGANQTVRAGEIYIRGPSLDDHVSKLSADGTQTITTFTGGITLIGGRGANAFAQIDPTNQTITSFGPMVIQGGIGPNADAIINSNGPQTVAQTGLPAGITLTGGSGPGADALINANGPQSVTSQFGAVTLQGGTGQNANAQILTTSPFQTVHGANGQPPILIAGPNGGLAGLGHGTDNGGSTIASNGVGNELVREQNQQNRLVETLDDRVESEEQRMRRATQICR